MRTGKAIFFPIVFIFLFAFFCRCGSGEGNQLNRQDKIKYKQYLVEGKRLYLQHCSNCHHEDGTGLARLYPPLKGSDYLGNNEKKVICSIKNGQSGEITINGIQFNQPMPSNPRLTNLEIAEITTYVYSTWGGKKKLFTHVEVGEILHECNN
jgi:mono/diheme cytochrome c family protein